MRQDVSGGLAGTPGVMKQHAKMGWQDEAVRWRGREGIQIGESACLELSGSRELKQARRQSHDGE